MINNSRKFLITNDEPSTVFMLSEFIKIYQKARKNLAISSIVAYTGLEAKNIVEDDKTLDLVIMNWEMPGMSGIHATELIREINPYLPVILYSAHVGDSVYMPIIEDYFDGFISSPIAVKPFVKVMDKYLLKK